jgi:hypothetical protein
MEHGGRIGLRSRPGGGTCFDLQFAAGESVQEAEALPAGPEALAEQRRRREHLN